MKDNSNSKQAMVIIFAKDTNRLDSIYNPYQILSIYLKDNLGKKLTLESNLHIEDCSQIAKHIMFLHEVLAGWCKINAPPLESTHVIAKEIIKSNSQIKCKNKILLNHE